MTLLSESVVLVCPLHDPEERILQELKNLGTNLTEIYGGLVGISVSRTTSKKTIEALKQASTHLLIQNKKTGLSLGDNYRQAIRLGLGLNTSHIHLMDFDRALHWVRRYPQELNEVVKKITTFSGFLSFVRTRRAFESHPLIQRTTETTINAIASEVAGVDVDIMSGSFGMDRDLATLIVKESKRQDFGIYAEFLEITLKHKVRVNTIEVDGLEWETPDQYQDKIEKEGYTAWLDEFESLPEWKKRVKLIEKSTEVLTKS